MVLIKQHLIILLEKITGADSKAVARVVSVVSATKIEIVYLNQKIFRINEGATGDESGVNGTVIALGQADKNVTNDYSLDNGQRKSYYDYGRIVRKKGRQSLREGLG